MITAVVLAAGSSTRMGRPKLLLPLAGKALVRHAVEAALGPAIDDVVVVTGDPGAAVARELAGLPVRFVENPLAADGQNTSVRAGLAALSTEVEAAVLVLGDQPLVGHALIAEIVAAYRRTRKRIVAPAFDGRRGNPVLFDRSLFAELAAVSGDQGGRSVINCHSGDIELVPIDDPRTQIDIDTWDEYQQLVVRAAGEDSSAAELLLLREHALGEDLQP